MNVPVPTLLKERLFDLDLRKSENATRLLLDNAVRVGRRAGAGFFLGEAHFMAHGVGDRVYRDTLRSWLEDISLLGNYTDLPLENAEYGTILTSKTGTTAWDSTRRAYVLTVTGNAPDMGTGAYVSIVFNGTPRVFRVSESITARRKELWPNVYLGSGVIVNPLTTFRCYADREDVDVFVGTNPRISADYAFILYEKVD